MVKDLSAEEKDLFVRIYQQLLNQSKEVKVLLQTYFGDVRDIYQELISLPFAGIGLDFVEGKETLQLVQSGFPKEKILYAGVVNGKNIWHNDYTKSIQLLKALPVEQIVLNTSCSLLHVPYTVANENFAANIKNHLAFAKEKLVELVDLATILSQTTTTTALSENQALFVNSRVQPQATVQQALAQLQPTDFVRAEPFSQREKI